MDESFVYICYVVSSFTFIFLIQEFVVSFDISLGSDYTWSLLLKSTFFRLVYRLEFSSVLSFVGFLAPHHDARLSAKHDRNANKNYDNQHLGNLLLTMEKENVCRRIIKNKLLVATG